MRSIRCSLALVLALAATSPAADAVRFETGTMGTTGGLILVTADSSAANPHADAAFAVFADVEHRFSNWTTTSEVADLNRRLGDVPFVPSPELRGVLSAALEIARASGGAFDPTVEPLVRLWGFLGGQPRVPGSTTIAATLDRVGFRHLVVDDDGLRTLVPGVRVDLGGIAKGHAVDRVADVLRARGVTDALIDLSGNMRGLGRPPGRERWTVGVRDPDTRDAWFARLDLDGDAIATSGDYEQFVAVDGHRYGHVLDPRTGWPVDDLVAVTIVAPTAMAADAWATAILVLGAERGRALLARRDDLAGVLVQKATEGRRRVWVESTLQDRFELVTGASARFVVEPFGAAAAAPSRGTLDHVGEPKGTPTN